MIRHSRTVEILARIDRQIAEAKALVENAPEWVRANEVLRELERDREATEKLMEKRKVEAE